MHSFYLPPGNLDLVLVSGPDAVRLLQGQLTCDVAAIPDPGHTRGALCNNKGRVLATFILVHHRGVFYLVLNPGLGNVLVAALKKFLPFYKCELHQASSADFACAGLAGDAAYSALTTLTATPPAAGQCSELTSSWICNLQANQYLAGGEDLATSVKSLVPGSLTDWLMAGMRNGQFPFLPDDAEKYTPQELHLDRHEFISFTKGCYTGQEIVARMHYRGKLKKLLFLIEAPTSTATFTEPMEVFDADGTALGSTLKLLGSNDALVGLVVLPVEMEQTGTDSVWNAAGLRFSARVF